VSDTPFHSSSMRVAPTPNNLTSYHKNVRYAIHDTKHTHTICNRHESHTLAYMLTYTLTCALTRVHASAGTGVAMLDIMTGATVPISEVEERVAGRWVCTSRY
jgi:hypothetical protein